MDGGVFTREAAVCVVHDCWGDSHFLRPADTSCMVIKILDHNIHVQGGKGRRCIPAGSLKSMATCHASLSPISQ